MSGNPKELFPNPDQPEANRPTLTPEEECLAALFDMVDVVDLPEGHWPCSEFFAATHGQPAPQDLTTNIHISRTTGSSGEKRLFPAAADVAAYMFIGFHSNTNPRGLYNIDFVRTREGIRAYSKEWIRAGNERVPQYVDTLSQAHLSALTADARKITQTIIATDEERLKLGPLVEEAGPDGLRRFHVGDILSVISGWQVSGRDLAGTRDLVAYMAGELPFSLQIGRFAQECKPYLKMQFDEKLAAFYEPPAEIMADRPSVYRWLGGVAQQLDGPFFTVQPLPEGWHARLDIMTEMELDLGGEFMENVTRFDIRKPDEA
ncbi:MAG TPA: hypothetical protein VF733_07040 [Candidatus Saccharimonadales bacterium]